MHLTAKILVIEDEKEYLDRILSRLDKKGYQSVKSVTTVSEAMDELAHHYDVIVADMRLGEYSAGGFTIVQEIQQRNITSIVIILTANDSVEDCRKALKGGQCWDYIPKTMKGSALDELHESIQLALASRENRQDSQWIQEHESELLEKYAGKYIAVINNQVVSHADSDKEINTKLERSGLPLFVTVIRKIEWLSPHNAPIQEVIKRKEGAIIEFKSTLGWCTRENKKNDALHVSVLKTIVAFLNTGSGTLLIGVTDEGGIYGLEHDFSLCKSKDADGFEQRLRDLIGSQIGHTFSEYIKIRFESIEEKMVCAVDVLKAPERAFLNDRFFIRAGNTTRELKIKEMYDHLKMRGEV